MQKPPCQKCAYNVPGKQGVRCGWNWNRVKTRSRRKGQTTGDRTEMGTAGGCEQIRVALGTKV